MEIYSEEDLILDSQIRIQDSKKGEKIPLYTSTPVREELLKKHGDTSKAIRALLATGMKQSQVAKQLNIRPQHVNNVSRQILKGSK